MANETIGQRISVKRKIVKRSTSSKETSSETTEHEALDLKKISDSSSRVAAHKEILKFAKYPRNELIRYFSKAEQPELLYFPSKTIVVTEKRFYPGPDVENVFTPIPEQIEMEPVTDIKSVHTIIPQTKVGTKEDMMLRPIRLLLSHPKLYELLGSEFNPKAYKTKGELLRAILNWLLTIKFVKFNRILYSTIAKYLQFLECQSALQAIADERVPFPQFSVAFLEGAPDYDNLLSLIPMVQEGTPEYVKIYLILELLSDRHLPELLGPGFVWTNYRTRGRLLIEILHRVSQLNYIRADYVRMMAITRFIEHVEDSMIPREIVLRAPFPEMNVVFENEPAPQLSVESVLPVTIPGTAIHVRLRPLRKFLARPDIGIILSDLNFNLYRKKGELLRAVIQKCLKSKQVESDPKLYTVVRGYWSYLSMVDRKVTTRTRITINYRTIIYALPPPKTETERAMMYVLQDYMSRPEFQSKIVGLVNLKVHRTRGVALKAILEKLTVNKSILGNQTVYDIFMYYRVRVQMYGYGAQAVDLIVSRERSSKFKFEVFSLFRALDHGRLTPPVKMSVARIIGFFTTNFQPSIYLASFPYTRYSTKGTFLQGLLQTLLVQGTVRPEIKADIVHVFPYIITTGPGAEKVDSEATRPGPGVHIIYL